MPNPEQTKRRFMDQGVKIWQYLGKTFGVRPATIVGILIGCVVVVAIAVNSIHNSIEIDEIQKIFCNGQASVTDERNNELCQDLLRKLLEDPNEANVERLKEVVRP